MTQKKMKLSNPKEAEKSRNKTAIISATILNVIIAIAYFWRLCLFSQCCGRCL